MAVLDIRKPQDEVIDKIQWGVDDFIRKDTDGTYEIEDAGGSAVTVNSDEIDHLIAALQKAKELWGPK